jgi:hypothetical protein
MHTYTYTYVCIYIYTYLFMHIMYIHTYIYMYMHIYICYNVMSCNAMQCNAMHVYSIGFMKIPPIPGGAEPGLSGQQGSCLRGGRGPGPREGLGREPSAFTCLGRPGSKRLIELGCTT